MSQPERAQPEETTAAAQPADTAPITADGAAPQPVELTPKAVTMVKLTRQEEGLDDSHGLRVAVVGGGCSGFQYALDFTNEARATDHVFQVEGLTVYVDPISARYLDGVKIDYVMGTAGAGFKFHNPNAVGSCGCGSSFAV